MKSGVMKERMQTICVAYKKPSWMLPVNILLLGVLFLCSFLLLTFEPVEQWHNTSFVLSHYEYQYSRYDRRVLALYTADGRRFVVNENAEELYGKLEEGRQYMAVYSDDLFHDTIKGFADSEREYINTDELRASEKGLRTGMEISLGGNLCLLMVLNVAYVIWCIRREQKKQAHDSPNNGA